MRDDEFGGHYGYLDYDLKLDKKAEKGCILILPEISSRNPTRNYPRTVSWQTNVTEVS